MTYLIIMKIYEIYIFFYLSKGEKGGGEIPVGAEKMRKMFFSFFCVIRFLSWTLTQIW